MNPSTKIIDALVAEYDKADSTGCALGIIRDGELVYQCGYGMADIEKSEAIDPLKSRFYVASVSKQFTAACILMLALHGKLSLEDDVRIYFPELAPRITGLTLRQFAERELFAPRGMRDTFFRR